MRVVVRTFMRELMVLAVLLFLLAVVIGLI